MRLRAKPVVTARRMSSKTFSEHSRVAALNSKLTVPEIPHEGVAFDDQRGGVDLIERHADLSARVDGHRGISRS